MDPSLQPSLAPTLTARGPDDLLGYVGHALGTLPAAGLVLVTLRGRLLRAVVRVDPPAASAAGGGPGARPGAPGPGDAGRWGAAVAAVCRRDRAATGVIVLRLDAGVRPGDAPPPWWPALRDALELAGLPVETAWTATGSLAWPLDGADAAEQGETPVAVDPRSSALSAHLVARGSVWGLRDADLLVPDARGARAAGPGWRSPAAGDREGRRRWLAAWEPVLEGMPLGQEAEDAAQRLGAPLTVPAWRDGLLLRAALGSSAPTVPRRLRERVLTASAAEPPHWPRLDRLWHACRGLAGRAPGRHAAQALAVAAWIAWARGHGGAAGVHLEAASRLDRDDPFIRVLGEVVGSGLVAEWAADPRTAWRP